MLAGAGGLLTAAAVAAGSPVAPRQPDGRGGEGVCATGTVVCKGMLGAGVGLGAGGGWHPGAVPSPDGGRDAVWPGVCSVARDMLRGEGCCVVRGMLCGQGCCVAG